MSSIYTSQKIKEITKPGEMKLTEEIWGLIISSYQRGFDKGRIDKFDKIAAKAFARGLDGEVGRVFGLVLADPQFKDDKEFLQNLEYSAKSYGYHFDTYLSNFKKVRLFDSAWAKRIKRQFKLELENESPKLLNRGWCYFDPNRTSEVTIRSSYTGEPTVHKIHWHGDFGRIAGLADGAPLTAKELEKFRNAASNYFDMVVKNASNEKGIIAEDKLDELAMMADDFVLLDQSIRTNRRHEQGREVEKLYKRQERYDKEADVLDENFVHPIKRIKDLPDKARLKAETFVALIQENQLEYVDDLFDCPAMSAIRVQQFARQKREQREARQEAAKQAEINKSIQQQKDAIIEKNM